MSFAKIESWQLCISKTFLFILYFHSLSSLLETLKKNRYVTQTYIKTTNQLQVTIHVMFFEYQTKSGMHCVFSILSD